MKRLSIVAGAVGFAALGLYSEIKTGSGTGFYVASALLFLAI